MNLDYLLTILNIPSEALDGSYGPIGKIIGVALVVLLFNFFIKTLLISLKGRFEKENRIWRLSFVTALQPPLAAFVWFMVALYTIDTLSENLFDLPLSYTHTLLKIGAVVAFGWFLLRLNKQVIVNIKEANQKRSPPLTLSELDQISKLVTIVIIFITAFLLLDAMGSSIQTLIAFGGIGGLALAFSSQQVISNFFGGFMVNITQPFNIGEWVSLPDKNIEGHVEQIGWYLTCIRGLDKRPVYVPNSLFTQTIVITPSRMTHERFLHTVGLRYCDIKVVSQVVKNIELMLLNNSAIDSQLPVYVYLKNFAPSSIDIALSAYIPITFKSRFFAIKQELLLAIAEIIEKENAEIAMPTSVVEFQGQGFGSRQEI